MHIEGGGGCNRVLKSAPVHVLSFRHRPRRMYGFGAAADQTLHWMAVQVRQGINSRSAGEARHQLTQLMHPDTRLVAMLSRKLC